MWRLKVLISAAIIAMHLGMGSVGLLDTLWDGPGINSYACQVEKSTFLKGSISYYKDMWEWLKITKPQNGWFSY